MSKNSDLTSSINTLQTVVEALQTYSAKNTHILNEIHQLLTVLATQLNLLEVRLPEAVAATTKKTPAKKAPTKKAPAKRKPVVADDDDVDVDLDDTHVDDVDDVADDAQPVVAKTQPKKAVTTKPKKVVTKSK